MKLFSACLATETNTFSPMPTSLDDFLGGYSRGDEFLIPHGNTVIEPHDHVIVFALPSAIPKVEKMFAG